MHSVSRSSEKFPETATCLMFPNQPRCPVYDVDVTRRRSLEADLNGFDCRTPLQRPTLLPLSIEVRRVEPALERRFACRPFRVEHGVPRGIAIVPLDDHMLAEDPLKGESQPHCCTPGRLVFRVALPFI